MNKPEAAQFLGVSVRSLERLAAQGRITKGRAQRKTRPCVDFAEADLERLKAELDGGEKREVSVGGTSGASSAHVGFRLDRYYAERLAEDGKKLGLSPGEYARKLVINSIEDTRDEQLKDEIRGLRLGLASAIYEVSVRGLGLTAEQAESLVARSILKGVRGA